MASAAVTQPPHAHRFGAPDVAMAVLMNLLWGLNIVAIKVTVGATAPFTAGAVRLGAVGLLCLPWLRLSAGRGGRLALFGLINGGAFLLFFNLALKVASNVGALAIAGQLSVPIALLLGVAFLGERLTRQRLAGVLLAFGGVMLLVFDPRVVHELPGLLLMTGAATMWATSTLMQRQLAGVTPLNLYCWTGIMGTAVLLPLSLALEPGVLARVASLPLAPIAWFAFSVLGATLVGQGGMAWLLGRHPLATIMPLTLAAPVVSVSASHLLLGTPVTALMVIGGFVTLAGVLLVTLAATRRAPVPAPAGD